MYCSNCKTTIEQDVYDYSTKKLGRALCRECQKSNSDKNEISSSSTFDYNMIKGRIAEALIEQLFIKLGYRVYRYGMENSIPGIMELLGGIKGEVADIIRKMPDFVIQHSSGNPFFVEVKFRKNETFSIKDIESEYKGEYPFENAFFVVVSAKHIKCLSYKQLKAGEKIKPDNNHYLGDVKEFETDKDVIIEFCKYAVKFFENV